ncbi:MAG: YeeE/YedE thiosulfate transporter family protein [Bdellovibrionota bacterium]
MEFTQAIVGGILIGFASALPLWWHGRVAGASGLLSDISAKSSRDRVSSLYYVLGLIGGAFTLSLISRENLSGAFVPLSWNLVVGAFLVGLGARLGNGCTSGHGVCGMGRFSKRSIIATMTFLATAMIVANLVRSLS